MKSECYPRNFLIKANLISEYFAGEISVFTHSLSPIPKNFNEILKLKMILVLFKSLSRLFN